MIDTFNLLLNLSMFGVLYWQAISLQGKNQACIKVLSEYQRTIGNMFSNQITEQQREINSLKGGAGHGGT